MKHFWMLVLILALTGCASSFQVDTEYPVDASLQIGELQQISSDAGVLFDWFWENNAFDTEESAATLKFYDEMISIMLKVRNEAIAGQIDYHRLNIRMGDLTDVWKLLKPKLQGQIDLVDLNNPNKTLLDRFAIATWNTLSGDMDNILADTNVALANARADMSEATYAAFKNDVSGIMKTFAPLVKLGMGGLGI